MDLIIERILKSIRIITIERILKHSIKAIKKRDKDFSIATVYRKSRQFEDKDFKIKKF